MNNQRTSYYRFLSFTGEAGRFSWNIGRSISSWPLLH